MTAVLPDLAEAFGEMSRSASGPLTSDQQHSTEPAPRSIRSRLAPLARPCAYFAASRVVVYFVALASKWIDPGLHPLRFLGTGWDGAWYTKIATYGYPHRIYNEYYGSRWAFFPGFPTVIRGTAEITRLSIPNAAVLDAAVLGLTSAIAIWLAVREVFGPVIADRSVLLYAFFPAAYVLTMAYSEGLFLTAAAGCLFALSRRYWVSAALLAVVASLTKDYGVLLVACVAVAAAPVVARERAVRPLVAVLVAPTGFVAWLVFSWRETGTPLAFLQAERFWGNGHFTFFLTPVVALSRLVTNPSNFSQGGYVLAAGGFVFAYIGAAILGRTRQEGIIIPPHWWVYIVGSLLAMASPNVLQSILRYSMAVFPLFAAYAWKVRRTWEGAIVGVLAMTQGALAMVVFVGTAHQLTTTVWP